ncbi:hypothetical protein [Halobacterium yunchengense]|uniref:hypothetical protein n=1 Tax=Halobacterium yunchengense TaxID=3108497 RepID=UPI00300AA5CE
MVVVPGANTQRGSVDALTQQGLPDAVTALVGLAGTLVLALVVVALVAFAYRSLTGGVDWPDEDAGTADADEEREAVERGDGETDDEWKYY